MLPSPTWPKHGIRRRKRCLRSSTRANSWGTRAFGTTTSWLNLSGAIILSEGESSRRTRHSSWRCASSAARTNSVAPASRQAASTRAASPATCSDRPSTSIKRIAAVPAGARDRTLRLAATASRQSPSTSSSAAGTTRARTRRSTASTAWVTLGNVGAHRRLHGRLRDQAKNNLRQNRERALRADEQVRQVVADDVLYRLTAGLDDLAGRQHGFGAEHVLFRHAVLECARAAGALGDVAADDRLFQARWIGRIEQADALDRILQIAGDDVGLDDGEQIALVDFEDAIEPLEAEDDAAAHRD